MTRVFAFTLATALAWVGHDCPGGCPPLAAKLPASAWFVRHLGTGHDAAGTLVVVDLGPDAGSGAVRDLLLDVNRCAISDGISVRERAASDRGDRDGDLTDRPAMVGSVHYLHQAD